MSFRVTTMARAARLPRTMRRRPAAKSVLLAVADRCNDEGRDAWPSVATIAAEVELPERTVQYCLRDLVAAAILEEQCKPRQHRPRTWKVNLDALERLALGVHQATPLINPGVQPQTPLKQTEPTPGVQIPAPGVQVSSPGVHVVDVRGAAPAPDPVLNCSLNRPLNKEPAALRASAAVSSEQNTENHDGRTDEDARLLAAARRTVAEVWPLTMPKLLEGLRTRHHGDYSEAKAADMLGRALIEARTAARTA